MKENGETFVHTRNVDFGASSISIKVGACSSCPHIVTPDGSWLGTIVSVSIEIQGRTVTVDGLNPAM